MTNKSLQQLKEEARREFDEKFKGIGSNGNDGNFYQRDGEIKLFIDTNIEKTYKEARREVIERIEKLIERERRGINVNKGTWGGEIEKVFPSMEFFLDGIEEELKLK